MIDKSILALGTLLALAQSPNVLADDMQNANSANAQQQTQTMQDKSKMHHEAMKKHHKAKKHHKKMEGEKKMSQDNMNQGGETNTQQTTTN